MKFDQVAALFAQVGPILDPLAIDAVMEEQTWGIAVGEDLTVLVQFDEQKNCLVLAADLGTPPAGDRTDLYELLLQINFHWNATGGNRLALNGPGGDVVQLYEIGAEGLDATRLSEIVASFAEAAKAGRELVQRPASAQGPTLEEQAALGIRA